MCQFKPYIFILMPNKTLPIISSISSVWYNNKSLEFEVTHFKVFWDFFGLFPSYFYILYLIV